MSDFYEDDEPVADALAAFDAGEKVVTGNRGNGQNVYLTLPGSVRPAGVNMGGTVHTVVLPAPWWSRSPEWLDVARSFEDAEARFRMLQPKPTVGPTEVDDA